MGRIMRRIGTGSATQRIELGGTNETKVEDITSKFTKEINANFTFSAKKVGNIVHILLNAGSYSVAAGTKEKAYSYNDSSVIPDGANSVEIAFAPNFSSGKMVRAESDGIYLVNASQTAATYIQGNGMYFVS